ncbi:MAG: hypothetical protein GY928_15290 [Colwellia sp.]|nr:hypothetical protein [Colwellia sp.]
MFIYFNNKTHTKELEHLKLSLNLDLERRKKVFEMKANNYEAYFNNIDTFYKKHQNDLQEIINPLLNKYLEMSLNTEDNNEAIIWFSNEIQNITLEGFNEQQALEHQTNSLKLTASSEVSTLLEGLQDLYNQIFKVSSEHMQSLIKIITNDDQQLAQEFQSKLEKLGGEIIIKSEQVRSEMQRDLSAI